MLIDPTNHFICLLIDDCIEGGGITTQNCFASSKTQSKAKFDLLQHHKVQQKNHFGTKNYGQQEDHYGTEGVIYYYIKS